MRSIEIDKTAEIEHWTSKHVVSETLIEFLIYETGVTCCCLIALLIPELLTMTSLYHLDGVALHSL